MLVAVWGRKQLTHLCLQRVYRAAQRSRQDVQLLAVTSTDDDEAVARGAGWNTITAPNAPLSDKHNAGAEALRGSVDALIVLGSDNWVCDRFFDVWRVQLAKRAIVGVIDVWQVCMHRPDALYFGGYRGIRAGESLGVARGIRKGVLGQLDWRPWPDGLNRGLDHRMRRRVNTIGHDTRGTFQHVLGVRVLGIKTIADNLTPFEVLSQQPSARRVPRSEALAPFPKDEVDALDALYACSRKA